VRAEHTVSSCNCGVWQLQQAGGRAGHPAVLGPATRGRSGTSTATDRLELYNTVWLFWWGGGGLQLSELRLWDKQEGHKSLLHVGRLLSLLRRYMAADLEKVCLM
jgi:hypothetical protein